MKEGRPPTDLEPAARLSFCWGGEEGGPPNPPGGKWGVGGEREGAKCRASFGAGGGDTKNLGSAVRPAEELPHPPFNKQPQNSRPWLPRNRGGGRLGLSRSGWRRGLRTGDRGRREALAAPASSHEPLRPAAEPGRRIPASASPHPPAS